MRGSQNSSEREIYLVQNQGLLLSCSWGRIFEIHSKIQLKTTESLKFMIMFYTGAEFLRRVLKNSIKRHFKTKQVCNPEGKRASGWQDKANTNQSLKTKNFSLDAGIIKLQHIIRPTVASS